MTGRRVSLFVAAAAILVASCATPAPQPSTAEPPAAVTPPVELSPTAGSTATPAGSPLVIEGTDGQDTAPFDLAAGDYRIQWQVTLAEPDFEEGACHFSADLATPEDRFAHGAGLRTSLPAGVSDGETYAYGVESGRHYLHVTPTCPMAWSFTITKVP